MKLAEALIEKKDLMARIGELQNRFTNAALVEQGETADEEASELVLSLEGALERLETLTVTINQTNNTVVLGEGSLMQAIAHRDNLKIQVSQFGSILNTIRHRNQNRRHYGENTPKMMLAAGIDPSTFIKKVDALSKELRLLDAMIQAANWANDLVA